MGFIYFLSKAYRVTIIITIHKTILLVFSADMEDEDTKYVGFLG